MGEPWELMPEMLCKTGSHKASQVVVGTLACCSVLLTHDLYRWWHELLGFQPVARGEEQVGMTHHKLDVEHIISLDIPLDRISHLVTPSWKEGQKIILILSDQGSG